MRTNHPTISGISAQWRLPGEFEDQVATLLAWPHAETDWASNLAEIRLEYAHFIELILQHQAVILLKDPRDKDPLPDALTEQANLIVVAIAFDDTWARDFGPICQVSENGVRLLDFNFNAWGKPYINIRDNEVNGKLVKSPEFRRIIGPFERTAIDFILEGGAIESNGEGSVLINWRCLETRHPTLRRATIEEALRTYLSVDQILGIEISPHEGDDTDGHIDTLARFIGPDAIAVQTLHDPVASEALLNQIYSLRLLNTHGEPRPLSVISLPMVLDQSPLPANYANFLFVNGACLVPTYGLESDDVAIELMSQALPNRRIIGVPCNQLITQFGGLHCASMHFPKPSLRKDA